MTTPTTPGPKTPGMVECPMHNCMRHLEVEDVVADMPKHTDPTGLTCAYEGSGRILSP